MKGKYFVKKCFLYFLIPSSVRHLCSNNDRDTLFSAFLRERTFLFMGESCMEIYRIAFIGHREIYQHQRLEEQIENIARDMLHKKEYVEFYVGRNGDFDISVASAIKRAQKAVGHHNSSLILLQPYPMKDDIYYEQFYDEIEYPIDGKTHPKGAITKRNRWMIEQADLVICYIEREEGGAYTALKYAQKLEKEIINLANK